MHNQELGHGAAILVIVVCTEASAFVCNYTVDIADDALDLKSFL